MRNVLAYETARRLGRHASRTRWVELWLNGSYRGVYVLMQRLELGKGRIEVGGPAQLVEWTFDFQARDKGTHFRLPLTRRPILFEDPERGDLSPRRRGEVERSLARTERALYGRAFRDRARGWRAHLDEAAAVDYVLLQELFKNQDASTPARTSSARAGDGGSSGRCGTSTSRWATRTTGPAGSSADRWFPSATGPGACTATGPSAPPSPPAGDS